MGETFLAPKLAVLRLWACAVLWKFKKQMQRAEDKHLSGRRNGLNFKKYKSYRLLLYRSAPPSESAGSPRRSDTPAVQVA